MLIVSICFSPFEEKYPCPLQKFLSYPLGQTVLDERQHQSVSNNLLSPGVMTKAFQRTYTILLLEKSQLTMMSLILTFISLGMNLILFISSDMLM